MGRSRVITITPNPALGKTLRTAMTAAGAEVRELCSAADVEPGPVAAELLVFHWTVEGEPDDAHAELELALLAELADRLPDGAHVIVLAPRGDLPTMVEALGAHRRVAAVMAATRVRAAQLTAMTTRLLFGDIFGLAKVLPWGARVHTLTVGDYAGKTDALQRISAFAAAVGLRRVHRDRIERCCDEMMMNALYDAPARADRKPMVDGALPGSGLALQPGDRAVVEFGCDGQRFAVSVRDRFGRFDREVLLRYLHKCLYEEDQIDRKLSGAGLGLYFLSRSASSVMFNLLPGAATECVCIFDGEATSSQLDQIAVFHERPEQAGRLAPHPPVLAARSILHAPVRDAATMPTEIVAPLRAPRPWRRPENRELDEERRATVQEPRLLRGLAGLARRARIPENARSVVAAAALLVVGISGLAIGLPRLFRASPAEPAPVAARPADVAIAGALSVNANVPGKVTVEGAPTCRERPLPLDRCPLPDGRHTVLITSDELHLRHSFVVEVRGRLVERSVRMGYVEARPGFRLRTLTGEPPVARMALPEGQQIVTLVDQAPGSWLDLRVPIRVDETVLVP